MAIDARKHVAPAAAETPRRQALNDLSLSINDPIPVANATERDQVLAALVAAGHDPTTRPVIVDRRDLGILERNATTSSSGWTGIVDAQPRFVTFQRALGTGTDSYSSPNFTNLLGGTWTAAPAGDYILHSTLVIAGSGNLGGNLSVSAGGNVISQANHRADVSTIATTITNAHPFTWAGGNLTVGVAHSVSTGSATVFNASTKAVVQYLGRRS